MDVSVLISYVSAIAAGGRHTCALTVEGGVQCWGRNGNAHGITSGVKAIAAGFTRHIADFTTYNDALVPEPAKLKVER